jgi:hypothetical protein
MALSGIELSAGIVVGVNKPVDGKYGPYANLAAAKADIGVTLRYLGLTVGITTGGVVEDYWWESGTADADLVAKGGGGGAVWGGITGTLSSQTDLQTALDGKVDENASITGATKTKITFDAKGLVTAGADATTADIADSVDKRYVTDAQATVIGNTSGTNTGDNATNSQYSGLDAAKTNKLITTNRQTASYTLVLADADKLVEMNVGSANNLTIPLNSSVAFATGTQILLAQYGAGQTTIVPTSGVTVRSNGSKRKLNVQYSGATLIKIATDEWYLFGDIVA